MTAILISKLTAERYGAALAEVAQRQNLQIELVHLPPGPQARLPLADSQRVDIAFFSRECRFSEENYYPKFCDALAAASNLKWLHFGSAGVDQHRFVPALLERGVALTTTAGVNAEPVAHTAIAGLLMLARKFPVWLNAQRRHAWEMLLVENSPDDLRGQTAMVVGLGNVGMPVAQLCQALGMHVIGIRRTPKRADDTLPEIHPLAKFAELLPRCQWLILCCPYTPETHHLVNAETLACLPGGAGFINVARGPIAAQEAVITALKSGQLGCAYLDVFEQEPLPADSPLWDLPNVIVTPHNASASSGSARRSFDIFLHNLENWTRNQPLRNRYTTD